MIAEANEIRENERLKQLNSEENDDNDDGSVSLWLILLPIPETYSVARILLINKNEGCKKHPSVLNLGAFWK